MIHTPPSPATPPPAPAETKAERTERQARALREMQAIILSVARAEEQVALARAAQAMNAAEAGVPPAPGSRPAQRDGADPALSISRIARALRLTLAMENQLYDDLAAEPVAPAKSPAAPKPEPSAEDARREAAGIRGCILGSTIVPVVEQAIQDAEDPEGDGSDTERRLDHLHERLVDEDEIVSFGTLPIGASIARICADLGLTPDWSLWEDEDWAIEEARTDAPGSPYATSSRQPSERRETNGSPSGGAAREAGGGGLQTGPESATRPLHHASRGPPPPVGEELGRNGVAVSLDSHPP
jgi:hypothetical protein